MRVTRREEMIVSGVGDVIVCGGWREVFSEFIFTA